MRNGQFSTKLTKCDYMAGGSGSAGLIGKLPLCCPKRCRDEGFAGWESFATPLS